MKSRKRDLTVLKKIVRYCNEVDATNEHFGDSLENLQNDFIYKNAAAMCVLQIGELISHLTDEFLAENPSVPWGQIRGMRNIAAHRYGEFDLAVLMEVMRNDTPALREYCQTILDAEKAKQQQNEIVNDKTKNDNP
jgi:uncharacterized protein with HEPN domain